LVLRSTHIYDPKTNLWTFGKQLPYRLAGAVACAATGEFAPKGIYLFGGYNNFNLNDDYDIDNQLTLVYDPANDRWNKGTRIPENIPNTQAAVLNDTMYVMGGRNTALIPTSEGPDYNPPPPLTTMNYQYIPFGYGTFDPIPVPSPSPTTTSSNTDIVPFTTETVAAVSAAVAAVVAVGLLVYFKKHQRAIKTQR
jgi:hypothetical protein